MASKVPLLGLRVSVTKKLQRGLKEAAQVLEDKIIENASLEDHSLKELEKLGHPYASRNPQEIHTPSYQVHTQSGDLVDAVSQRQINQYAIDVGVDETKAPHVVHVIYGTSKMVARDFIRGSYLEVIGKIRGIVQRSIRDGVKESR